VDELPWSTERINEANLPHRCIKQTRREHFLPTGRPCNAGFVDMEWVTEDRSKSDLQKSLRDVVLSIQTVPQQGFFSVPAESVLAVFLLESLL